jgi:hypothetical protein
VRRGEVGRGEVGRGEAGLTSTRKLTSKLCVDKKTSINNYLTTRNDRIVKETNSR